MRDLTKSSLQNWVHGFWYNFFRNKTFLFVKIDPYGQIGSFINQWMVQFWVNILCNKIDRLIKLGSFQKGCQKVIKFSMVQLSGAPKSPTNWCVKNEHLGWCPCNPRKWKVTNWRPNSLDCTDLKTIVESAVMQNCVASVTNTNRQAADFPTISKWRLCLAN